MKIEYDKATDSLYIHLSDKPSTESEEVAADVIVDYDKSGAPVGIDIQHASKHTELDSMSFQNLSAA